MAHRLLRDPEADGWERSDFPIVCETCLGPNPYVRMQRIEYGGECHISGRPYTVFRWRPGSDARYKKTIICQEVAKAKNVCQVCLLDLDYNLPVQVRDQALGADPDDELPESDVGKEYALAERAKDGTLQGKYLTAKPNDTILALQRTTPYYKRNRAPVCSFFARGECKRGAECPYRHELPTVGELADQNIKDRYYGVNDPVAKKMLNRVDQMPDLSPPEDQTITTLFVGNVGPSMKEADIRDQFYSFGEIKSIKRLESASCAFVTFTERSAAERAARELHNKLIINGQRCRLMWGKPQAPKPAEGAQPSVDGQGPRYGAPPPLLPPQVAMQMGAAVPYPAPPPATFFGLAPLVGHQPSYSSMDPQQQGTRIPAPGEASPRPAGPTLDGPPKRQRVDSQGGAGPPPDGPGYGGMPPMYPGGPPYPGHPGGFMRPPPPGFPYMGHPPRPGFPGAGNPPPGPPGPQPVAP